MEVTISDSTEKRLRNMLADLCEKSSAHGIARDLRGDQIIGGWPLLALTAMREAYKAGVSDAY